MGYLSEKAAYLKGLTEGLEIDKSSKEGKLLAALVEAFDEMAIEVDDMVIIQEDMQEQLDEVDEALADLEDDYYALDEDLEEDYDEEFDELDDLDDLDEEWDEEYSFECPKCGDVVYINPELIDDDVKYIVCPNCEEKILLEFDTDNE
ncbi:MAG: hypothetical protein IJ297_00295 [Clostridia bacterium]|nr:hypothetical protein [Clostridia bacterium]